MYHLICCLLLQAKVTWAPQDEWQIKKVCESKVRKRLFDLLSKVRVKKDKPSWMGEDAWDGLLTYWDSDKFKEISSQNKLNWSSCRGGSLHSTSHKSHLDITLGLVSTIHKLCMLSFKLLDKIFQERKYSQLVVGANIIIDTIFFVFKC